MNFQMFKLDLEKWKWKSLSRVQLFATPWTAARQASLSITSFGIANVAEVDAFLELSCFFCDSVDVGNLISGYSAFSKSSLNVWKFSVHELLKSGWRILSITLLVCEMSTIVW